MFYKYEALQLNSCFLFWHGNIKWQFMMTNYEMAKFIAIRQR